MLESLGLCQKWQLCLKQDGMHPEDKPLESVLHLRLWPDGGVTGVVERDKGLGDIFGHWDMKSICFFILHRQRTRFMDKVNKNWKWAHSKLNIVNHLIKFDILGRG